MQIDGDLDDLQSALTGVSRPLMGTGHCSALVKLLPNNADLYVAQDTWTEYQQMLRILKKYVFEFYMTSEQKRVWCINTKFSSVLIESFSSLRFHHTYAPNTDDQ